MVRPHVALSLSSAGLRARVIDALAGTAIDVVEQLSDEPHALYVVDERSEPPGNRHIVLVETVRRRQTAELLDAGAEGIVSLDTISRALAPTIQAVLAGQIVVPRSVRKVVRRPMLSPREKQILGMVVIGCTNQEIAARLHLAPSTIKSHLGTMFAELGVKSRKEAADLVLDPTAGLGTGILRITNDEQAAVEQES